MRIKIQYNHHETPISAFYDRTSGSFSSIAATVDLLLTVILEGIGKCSISSPDLPSVALFFLKLSFVGRGCNMRKVFSCHIVINRISAKNRLTKM